MVNGEKHDGPIVRLSYDVSPMQVVLEETRKPLLESILGMAASASLMHAARCAPSLALLLTCACSLSVLGGVYTCSAMIESILQALHANVKKAVGKAM